MSRNALIAGVAVLFCGAAACGLYIWEPWQSNLVKVCERTLKASLKAPSSYRRISVQERKIDISLAQWRAAKAKEPARNIRAVYDESARMKERGDSPAWLAALLEYEAINSFGASLRSTAECVYLSQDGSPRHASPLNTFLNGETLLGQRLDGASAEMSRMSCREAEQFERENKILDAPDRRLLNRIIEECR
ncbi:MAG: hypothetical protein KF895_03185 [Parvibaculum sp.]|nr:hypothetical protein [Parvibaculum sp.]